VHDNHSAHPNVEYVQDEPSVITFLARRRIRAGEELTIDDGQEWCRRDAHAEVIATCSARRPQRQ
jgi:SET domain-containing protein